MSYATAFAPVRQQVRRHTPHNRPEPTWDQTPDAPMTRRVQRVRDELAAGTYTLEDKLDIAIERMLADL